MKKIFITLMITLMLCLNVAYADSVHPISSKIHEMSYNVGTKVTIGEEEHEIIEAHGSWILIDIDSIDTSLPLKISLEDGDYEIYLTSHGHGNQNGKGETEYWVESINKIIVEEEEEIDTPPIEEPIEDEPNGDNPEEEIPPIEEEPVVYDAHFFVRVDRVVQKENGSTHYDAKYYFPIGQVASGYKYGSNVSDYTSADGKVDTNNAHMNYTVPQDVVTEEVISNAEEMVYTHITSKPTIEEVITAAKAYGLSDESLENVEVLWYVVKQESKIHVDGVLYNKVTNEIITQPEEPETEEPPKEEPIEEEPEEEIITDNPIEIIPIIPPYIPPIVEEPIVEEPTEEIIEETPIEEPIEEDIIDTEEEPIVEDIIDIEDEEVILGNIEDDEEDVFFTDKEEEKENISLVPKTDDNNSIFTIIASLLFKLLSMLNLV